MVAGAIKQGGPTQARIFMTVAMDFTIHLAARRRAPVPTKAGGHHYSTMLPAGGMLHAAGGATT